MSFLIAIGAGVVMLAGAFLGAVLRRILPAHHLNDHSKDIIRLGCALIATMSALVLGLLITSAKTSYDTQRNEIRQITAKLVLLDSQLERYGPEARRIREIQRESIPSLVERIWGKRAMQSSAGAPYRTGVEGERVYDAIQALSPQNELQRVLKFQALQTITQITESRVLLFEQSDSGLPAPLLAMLVFWLTILFASFTLFSPINPTGGIALAIIALSAAGAIFLILELNNPFGGLMEIPVAPFRDALGRLGP